MASPTNTTMSVGLDRLPTEIFLMILHYLSTDISLLHLSLTSRRLHALTQPLVTAARLYVREGEYHNLLDRPEDNCGYHTLTDGSHLTLEHGTLSCRQSTPSMIALHWAATTPLHAHFVTKMHLSLQNGCERYLRGMMPRRRDHPKVVHLFTQRTAAWVAETGVAADHGNISVGELMAAYHGQDNCRHIQRVPDDPATPVRWSAGMSLLTRHAFANLRMLEVYLADYGDNEEALFLVLRHQGNLSRMEHFRVSEACPVNISLVLPVLLRPGIRFICAKLRADYDPLDVFEEDEDDHGDEEEGSDEKPSKGETVERKPWKKDEEATLMHFWDQRPAPLQSADFSSSLTELSLSLPETTEFRPVVGLVRACQALRHLHLQFYTGDGVYLSDVETRDNRWRKLEAVNKIRALVAFLSEMAEALMGNRHVETLEKLSLELCEVPTDEPFKFHEDDDDEADAKESHQGTDNFSKEITEPTDDEHEDNTSIAVPEITLLDHNSDAEQTTYETHSDLPIGPCISSLHLFTNLTNLHLPLWPFVGGIILHNQRNPTSASWAAHVKSLPRRLPSRLVTWYMSWTIDADKEDSPPWETGGDSAIVAVAALRELVQAKRDRLLPALIEVGHDRKFFSKWQREIELKELRQLEREMRSVGMRIPEKAGNTVSGMWGRSTWNLQ